MNPAAAADGSKTTYSPLLSFLILLFMLALPSGVEALFDGLPLSRRPELWTAAVIIPFLLILDRSFLRLRAAVWILGGMALLKFGLFIMCPASGWDMRVYASPQAHERGQWERTYTSIFRPGISEVLDKPLGHGREFPIEWMNRLKDREGLWLGVELEGFARLPQGTGLALVASGLEVGRASMQDPQGNTIPIPITPSPGAAANLDSQRLPQGQGKINAYLTYLKGNWTLMPVVVYPGGQVKPAFKQGIIWREATALKMNNFSLGLATVTSQVLDYSFLLWLLAWCLWALGVMWKRGIITPPLFLLSIVAVFIPSFINILASSQDKLTPLAWGVFHAAAALAFLTLWRKETWVFRSRHLGKVVIFTLGPAIFIYFLELWSSQLGKMSFYSQGDDWLTYQNFARQIFVDGDWLHLGRPVFHVQPLYRYIVGFLHLVFGQSPLAQNLLDVWAALGAGALLAGLGIRMKLSPFFALAGVCIYMAAELGTNMRGHIGRGLQEHSAMLFMMLAAWAAANSQELTRPREMIGLILAGLFASVGYWLRQDHLGVLAGLGLLALPHQTQEGLKAAWAGMLRRVTNYWRRPAVYWGLLGLAVLAVALRNWLTGGLFALIDRGNINHLTGPSFSEIIQNFQYVLLASEQGLDWLMLVLLPGTLIGLAALMVRPAYLKNYPLALSLALVGLLAPCLFLRLTAYIPRWSIHLLPLSVLSLSLFIQGATQVWLENRQPDLRNKKNART